MMRNALRFLVNEARLMLYRQRRYLFEFCMSSLFLLAVFAGLVAGVHVLPDSAILPDKVSLAVGFVVWSFAIAAFGSLSSEISDEIRARCLEQLCLLSRPLWNVLLMRSVVHLAGAMVSSLVLLHVCFWIVDEPMDVDVLPMIAVLLLAAPSLLGVGYLVGAINILFKQVETISAVAMIAVVVLVSVPAYPLNEMSLLPFSYAATKILATRTDIVLGGYDVAIILLNSLGYFAAGLWFFNRCHRAAAVRGSLGHA